MAYWTLSSPPRPALGECLGVAPHLSTCRSGSSTAAARRPESAGMHPRVLDVLRITRDHAARAGRQSHPRRLDASSRNRSIRTGVPARRARLVKLVAQRGVIVPISIAGPRAHRNGAPGRGSRSAGRCRRPHRPSGQSRWGGCVMPSLSASSSKRSRSSATSIASGEVPSIGTPAPPRAA